MMIETWKWFQCVFLVHTHRCMHHDLLRTYPAPRWGGGKICPPSRIFSITQKRRAITVRNFWYLFPHQFYVFLPNKNKIGREIFEKFSKNWRHFTRLLDRNGVTFQRLSKTEFSIDFQYLYVKWKRMNGATKWLSRIFKILKILKNILKNQQILENFE